MDDKIRSEIPCDMDHNGECLVCDCWLENCAYMKYLKKDFRHYTQEEFEKMFPDIDIEEHRRQMTD